MMSEPRSQYNLLKTQSMSPCARTGCVGWGMRVHAACHARVPYVTSYKAPAVAITEALELPPCINITRTKIHILAGLSANIMQELPPSSVIKVRAE